MFDFLFNKAFAATTYQATVPVIQKINENIINPLIGFLFALALVMFLWGVFEFIAGADNEEKRSTGQTHMLWGIIGLFIMVSVFGIMRLICNTIGC